MHRVQGSNRIPRKSCRALAGYTRLHEGLPMSEVPVQQVSDKQEMYQ